MRTGWCRVHNREMKHLLAYEKDYKQGKESKNGMIGAVEARCHNVSILVMVELALTREALSQN